MSWLTLDFEAGGVHLPRLGLWLDPQRSQRGPERVVVSHAHSDHIAAHREVILTAPTSEFLSARLRGRREEHRLAFGEPRLFKSPEINYTVTLLPAGHILGSAMALVEAGGESLLYTGDFKLRAGLTAETCQPRPAQVLVMETTFGKANFSFPPASEVWRSILDFCRQALADGVTPVLFGYSLGKSQDLLRGVTQAGLPVMVHETAYRLGAIYERFGQALGPHQAFRSAEAQGKVLIFPPQGRVASALAGLGPVRTAVCTGWAAEPGCRFRYGVDAAFPLSDHADYAELIELVDRVAPKQVLTLHGYAAPFAQTLRDLGWDARALSEPDQLHLRLNGAIPAAARELGLGQRGGGRS